MSQFLSMHIGDSSRAAIPDYDFVAWPSRGFFPREFLLYGGAVYPWSVTLNPAKYRVVDQAALKVEIAGAADGFRMTFDKKDKLANYGMIGDDDIDKDNSLKKFLYFLPATASWQPSILFFPGEGKFPEPKAGARYRVTISGVADAQGKPVSIAYWVEFFSLPKTGWLQNSYAQD
jgi:hypothetical protein